MREAVAGAVVAAVGVVVVDGAFLGAVVVRLRSAGRAAVLGNRLGLLNAHPTPAADRHRLADHLAGAAAE